MGSTDDSARQTLDVYAKPFIPQSLKDVNEAPANIVPCAPIRWIGFKSYIQSFAGSDILTALPRSSDHWQDTRSLLHTTPGVTTENNAEVVLNPFNYGKSLHDALHHEAAALQEECEDHALYRVTLLKASGLTDPRPSMYTLGVPGLRELSLRIEIGDIVQLRQLRFNQYGQVTHGSLIKDNHGSSIVGPRKNDTQHNGVVWGIDRLRETLSLRVDSLTPRSSLFNVRFTVQSSRLDAVHEAIMTAEDLLQAAPKEGWIRSMLFPEDFDGYYQKTLNKAFNSLDLYDSLLNYEQQRAVNTVLNESYGPVPFIVSGPPGTGKTKTVVELALQMVQRNTNTHLLVCAPSDPAADILTQRLSKELKPSQLLRINSPSRSFPEVPNTILPFCCVDDGMFSLPAFRDLMRLKIVVTTCRDADLLVQVRVTNRDLHELQVKLHGMIHPEDDQTLPVRSLHWTGLLMDEAAQATEPEALIALSVIAPPEDDAHTDVSTRKSNLKDQELPIFVMAGDQHQLGPRTASQAMRTSLFERILDRPFYRDHPLARSKQNGGVMRPLTQDMLPILRPAFANLIRNYRSHPAILATPSRLFYNDTLEPESTEAYSLLSWPGWKGRGWPSLFVCNTGADEIERDGGGWFNVQEAQWACQYAQSFLQAGLLQPNEICIMSPFRAQVRILRNIARAPPFLMSAVNIGPLEAFQGVESKLVILCTTRTRDRFIDQDVARGLGVIHEPKRFNVALTRAKAGLIVIGNPDVLGKDENWKAFIDFSRRNGLHIGLAGASTDQQRAIVSRLETQLLHQEQRNEDAEEHQGVLNGLRKLGFRTNEEHELWASGVAAEESLKTEE